MIEYGCAALSDADMEDGEWRRYDCGQPAVVVGVALDEGFCEAHLPIKAVAPLADLAKRLPLRWDAVRDAGEYGLDPVDRVQMARDDEAVFRREERRLRDYDDGFIADDDH